MHRVLISRITHGLDATPQFVFLVPLTLLWFVIWAISSVQARMLDFTVEVNQTGPRFTVQANDDTTLHWMGGEGSRSKESADVLTVDSGNSRDTPPDDKPRKSCNIWSGFDTLIESVPWQPLYVQEIVVGYRLWLSLQENSPSINGFSWWPVVTGVVLGKFFYTWWHSEASSFHQWEEQQQHRVSDQKIITCMEHPPGQSGYPQGGGGPGVSNQWTAGYNNRGNSFSMYGGYDPSGGGGGSHDPHDGHTRNYRPCPACCQQPCQYPVESNPHYYYRQPDSLMNGAPTLFYYLPGSEVSANHGDEDWFEYQGGNAMATATSSETSSETGRVFIQQEPPVHESDHPCNGGFLPSRGDSGFSSGIESTTVSLRASVQPPAPGCPSDHEPNDPGCVCRLCLDFFIEYATLQWGNGAAGAISVENSDVSERPTAVVSPWAGTTSESDVHQQPEFTEKSEPPSKKSGRSSQKKPPGRKRACSYPGCTKSYSSSRDLREHEASHLGKWVCSYPGCTKSYSSTRGLREHEASHLGKWACSYPGCTKSYSSTRGLREHEASHLGKWACSYPGCTKSYSNAQSIREHEASHLGKWTCSYPGCTKSYSCAQRMKEHEASHEGKWACSHTGCTKSYSSAQGLREHKASHLGKWVCSRPGCTKSYSNAQTLREHQASHQGKWACSYAGCTKSYSRAQPLRKHEASHQRK